METRDYGKAIELFPQVYWVGFWDKPSGLHCNPYLLVDGDEAVLIDPGSPLDFEMVYTKVTSIVPLEKIKFVVLQHQDPDLCASVPLFEARGLKAQIATHWRASMLIRYYGVKSPFYRVNEHKWELTFGNGRILRFHPTPYLHFPGAIATHDELSKILFTSDLFGAFSQNWSLFADEVDCGDADAYLEGMKTFHEHYMPGNEVLRPVMEKLLSLDISMLAPQHGSVIRRDIPSYVKGLRDLECGSFLQPIKKDLSQIDGFTGLCNQILKRYYAIFSRDEVAAVFAGTHITLDPGSGLITDYNCTGRELWHEIFRLFNARRGIGWLSFIEPYVTKLAAEYGLDMPDMFTSLLLAAERDKLHLSEENLRLAAIRAQLQQNLDQAGETLLKCPLTKLSNEQVFRQYLRAEAEAPPPATGGGTVLAIYIDDMVNLNITHGVESGDGTIQSVAYLLDELRRPNHSLFRLTGPAFAYYIAGTSFEEALAFAEQLRTTVEKATVTIRPVTVSVGAAALSEARGLPMADTGEAAEVIFRLARSRATVARLRGGNLVCHESVADLDKMALAASVLVADTDELNTDVLTTIFRQMNYRVLTAADGAAALELIGAHNPDVIVCEAMLPQLDGFTLRERSLQVSAARDSLFVLMSHHKDGDSVQRALALEINHYFRKPFLLSELVGVVRNFVRNRTRAVKAGVAAG